MDVFVVVREDEYETRFGDGYFAYYAAGFATRAEADAFVRAKAAERKPTDNSGYRYHVRPATLTRGPDGTWTMTADLEANERLDTNGDGVKTDVGALARSLATPK